MSLLSLLINLMNLCWIKYIFFQKNKIVRLQTFKQLCIISRNFSGKKKLCSHIYRFHGARSHLTQDNCYPISTARMAGSSDTVWEQPDSDSLCSFPHPSNSEQPKSLPSDMQNASYPAPSQWMAFYYAYMSEPEGAMENIWNCGVCQKPFESSHKHGKSKHLASFHLWVKLQSLIQASVLHFHI